MRTSDDLNRLSMHLMFKVPFFIEFRHQTIYGICQNVSFFEIQKGQYLMREGDLGDRMFIIV